MNLVWSLLTLTTTYIICNCTNYCLIVMLFPNDLSIFVDRYWDCFLEIFRSSSSANLAPRRTGHFALGDLALQRRWHGEREGGSLHHPSLDLTQTQAKATYCLSAPLDGAPTYLLLQPLRFLLLTTASTSVSSICVKAAQRFDLTYIHNIADI
jgi:hypothetical protein